MPTLAAVFSRRCGAPTTRRRSMMASPPAAILIILVSLVLMGGPVSAPLHELLAHRGACTIEAGRETCCPVESARAKGDSAPCRLHANPAQEQAYAFERCLACLLFAAQSGKAKLFTVPDVLAWAPSRVPAPAPSARLPRAPSEDFDHAHSARAPPPLSCT